MDHTRVSASVHLGDLFAVTAYHTTYGDTAKPIVRLRLGALLEDTVSIYFHDPDQLAQLARTAMAASLVLTSEQQAAAARIAGVALS